MQDNAVISSDSNVSETAEVVLLAENMWHFTLIVLIIIDKIVNTNKYLYI